MRCEAKRDTALGRIVQSRGFTLVELILVMALLVVAISLVSPHLSGFFRGRALQSEAHQLMSLIHDGQSRAVSSGVPMILWFDADTKKYGLEEQPGYTDKDPNAVEITLGDNLRIEVPDANPGVATTTTTMEGDTQREGLPQINFLPDGTLSETSPQSLKIIDGEGDGPTVSLTQTRDRNDYEIATTPNP